ncbi:beta-lactamase domain-containing protein [Planococcus antarcticus DSM 14505]|uniref:Beta-lactamase domain-containing protein n=1 Tax=Planococcus antarcticus DSM 14505 TaxID=1185653 RepID=A0AA87IKJ4_9BACL|nr:beta-lactamase domain-containing protein [Planococcus antarcticus DSM 14505]
MQPSIAATGHGKPMAGAVLAKGLVDLAENFQQTAVPAYGKYVHTK